MPACAGMTMSGTSLKTYLSNLPLPLGEEELIEYLKIIFSK